MTNIDKIIATYNKRAKSYDSDMVWLNNPTLFIPISVPVFGNGKALDACSGTGCVASCLKNIGWDVTAVDICKEMLQQVDKNITRVVADVANLPFDDGEFDISVCRQGLQYTDMESAISSLFRVTKSKVVLGHITIEDRTDRSFWKKYFSIASPGRRNVFLPGEIKKTANSFNWLLEEEKIFYDSASLLSPIKYLKQDEQEQLYLIIKNTNQAFKSRNGITITNDDIIYKRRWEFQTYIKI